MGFGSVWHWLIVLLVILLLFGTKKLRNVGGDLGAAIRSFRKGLQEGGEQETDKLGHQPSTTTSSGEKPGQEPSRQEQQR